MSRHRFTAQLEQILPAGDRRVAMIFFLVAVALYAPGIWWGLPHATAVDRIYPWGSDEIAPQGAFGELYNVFVKRQPPFNPRYPLFHFYLQAAFAAPYLLFLWLTGGIHRFSSDFPFGFTDPVTTMGALTLLNRLPSLLMAGGVVVAAFRTATLLWDRRTGILAGATVLLMYPMFYYSRTSNVDMAALFWTALGLGVFAVCLQEPLTTSRAIALGALAAIAVATKDASVAAFASCAAFLVPWHLRRSGRAGWTPLWIGFGVAVTVYALASGLVFHLGRYWTHLQWITLDPLRASYRSPATLAGQWSLLLQIAEGIVDSLGAPVTILAIAGLLVCLVRAPATLALGLPALGTILLLIVGPRFALLRYILVIAYVLALFAARALAEGMRSGHRHLRWVCFFVMPLAFGWSAVRAADLTYQMLFDSRYEAGSWFARNARTGDRVLYYTNPCNLPPLQAGIVSIPIVQSSHPQGSKSDPEFVLVIPVGQLPSEARYEPSLPARIDEGLRDGSLGYRQALEIQTPSWFSRRPATFVNPSVKVFVRADRLATLADKQAMLRLQ